MTAGRSNNKKLGYAGAVNKSTLTVNDLHHIALNIL